MHWRTCVWMFKHVVRIEYVDGPTFVVLLLLLPTITIISGRYVYAAT